MPLEKLFPVHPMFFNISNKFAPFKLEDDGDIVEIKHPQFSATFNRVNGFLECEDADIAEDLAKLISDSYGTFVTREEAHDMVPWDSLAGAAIIHAGVCYFPSDPTSGWDGSLNAIWADNSPPGKVINTYYSWTLSDDLHSFRDLSDSEVIDHPDRKAIIRSMIVYKATHPEEASEIDDRIKEILNVIK